jgi:hypothetical protein
MFRKMITDYRAVYVPDEELTNRNLQTWLCSVNSYLGICKHYNTYRLRAFLVKRFTADPVVRFDKAMCVVSK